MISMRISPLTFLLVIIGGFADFDAAASTPIDSDLLTPKIKVGEHFSNVFSIASSVRIPGFEELVKRNGGSADYTVTAVTPDGSFTFHNDAVYYGQPAQHVTDVVSNGGATDCWEGQCRTYTDASGLLYNHLLWGTAPKKLRIGVHWTVSIPQPWEMGPAGTQTVTVIGLDSPNGFVTLKREGTASGLFANEPAEVTLTKGEKAFKFTRTAGEAHWIGFTTFRHGIVWSDELLVVRTDELKSNETESLTATKRLLMLLNAAPFPTV